MKVLFVAAECAPYAKVGGLADVVWALSKALRELSVETAIFIPKYRGVEDNIELAEAGELSIAMGGGPCHCRILKGTRPKGGPIYFLDYPPYFDRAGIYGERGEAYPDSLERFALLSRAALELPGAVGFAPDIFHIHDWHTSLVPAYLRFRGFPRSAKILLTIHNLAHQGIYPLERAVALGLPDEGISAITYRGKLNLLYGGIKFADLVTTVSPSYAREIQENGEGLEEILRERAAKGELVGILNGIDYDVWDPKTDPLIWANYSADDPSGKAANKAELQKALGLSPEPKVPLVGMISRLVDQKGFDLVMEAFERMMSLGIQFVLLGTGDPEYEEFFARATRRYPGRAAALITFSEEWAHRIEAACDIFLMPSKFEPCGLNQMYSLRYGAVPVVRATGGLRDTVREYDPRSDTGNGFVFEEYRAEAMLAALKRAVGLYRRDPEAWVRIMVRGMREDHSWAASAREYLRLYEKLSGSERSGEGGTSGR